MANWFTMHFHIYNFTLVSFRKCVTLNPRAPSSLLLYLWSFVLSLTTTTTFLHGDKRRWWNQEKRVSPNQKNTERSTTVCGNYLDGKENFGKDIIINDHRLQNFKWLWLWGLGSGGCITLLLHPLLHYIFTAVKCGLLYRKCIPPNNYYKGHQPPQPQNRLQEQTWWSILVVLCCVVIKNGGARFTHSHSITHSMTIASRRVDNNIHRDHVSRSNLQVAHFQGNIRHYKITKYSCVCVYMLKTNNYVPYRLSELIRII